MICTSHGLVPESDVPGEQRQICLGRREQNRFISGPAAEYMSKIAWGEEKNEDRRWPKLAL
jgi:hypothetical protein